MEIKHNHGFPSEAEIEVAEVWIDEHYGPGSVPLRVKFHSDEPDNFVLAVAMAMTRRRDQLNAELSQVSRPRQ